MMKNRTIFIVPALLCILILSGCGNKNQSLSGKVTFSDDDSPVPAGAIYFTDGTHLSQGSITDGTYVVGTKGKADGLPPGTYKVYFGGVNKRESYVDAESGTHMTKTTHLIASKYASADTSGLTFTVDGKTKTFDVLLDRAK